MLRRLWEAKYNVAVEVRGSDYVRGDGRHCHAGIPPWGSYQFLCKVAIHIRQSAWDGGLWFRALWRNDLVKTKGRHVSKYAVTVCAFVSPPHPPSSSEHNTSALTNAPSSPSAERLPAEQREPGASCSADTCRASVVLNVFVYKSKAPLDHYLAKSQQSAQGSRVLVVD